VETLAMTMPLPDIDQQAWDSYEQQNLADELKRKFDGFGLQQAINDKMAGVQSLLGGNTVEPQPPAVLPPEPEPAPQPTPEQGLANVGSWATSGPPQTLSAEAFDQPQPTPAPEPVPPPPPPEPAAPATPSPPSGSGNWLGDLFGSGLNAVYQAGGDVDAFAQSFGSHLGQAGSDASSAIGGALNAASSAGADIERFMGAFQIPQQAAAPLPSSGIEPAGTPVSGVSGVPDWLSSLIARNAPELANDPEFIRTVAAGAKAESGWDVNRVQNGYRMGSGAGARGLFQFDMAGMGAGIPEEALLGQSGAELQASRIVPLYAKAYQSAPQGLSSAEKASWVAAQAERPFDYQNPNSAARRNYASAFNDISAGPGQTPTDLLARTGGWAEQAASGSEAAKPDWLRLAEGQLGKPYIWGSGSGAGGRGRGDIDPETGIPKGFDCSGFVSYVYENALGIKLPAQTAAAYDATKPITMAQARPGDIVLYNMDDPSPRVQHIAIYLGDGKIIQSGGVAKNVNIGDLGGPGSYQFRRADGAETALGNARASYVVSDHLDPSTLPPPGVDPERYVTHVKKSVLGQFEPAVVEEPQERVMAASELALPREEQSPVDRLKSAFGDFLDSFGSSAQERVSGIQSPESEVPVLGGAVINPVGTAMSALGTGVTAATDVLDQITPTSIASREIVGQDVYSQKYREAGGLALEQELKGLLDQKLAGDESVVPRMADISNQLNAINEGIKGPGGFEDVNQRLSEENPGAVTALSLMSGLGAGVAATPLTLAEAPVAARVAAEVLQPGSNAGELLGLGARGVRAAAGEVGQAIEAAAEPARAARAGQSLEEFLQAAPRADDVVETKTVQELASNLRTPQGQPGISIEPGYFGLPGGSEVSDTGTRYAVYRNEQGQPVGVLEMFIDRATGQPDLLQVAVDPEYQRQGIATSLYRAAEEAGFNVEAASGAGGYTEEGAKFAYSRLLGEGEPARASAGLAARAAGGVGGAAAGWQTAPEDASIQERLLRAGVGGAAGLAGSEAALRAPGWLSGRVAQVPNTGNTIRDETLRMLRAQDTEPPKWSQAADWLAETLGTGERTGTLDRAMADKNAYINQMNARAKRALGSMWTPEMDAEAAVATLPGRGARAKLLVDDEIVPALKVARDHFGQRKADEYLNEYRKYQRDLEVANLFGGTREASAGIKSAADAQAALDGLEQEVGAAGWQVLQQADQMLIDATNRLLQERVRVGMVKPDLAQRLMDEQPHFNPTVFLKYLDEGAGGAQSGGNRMVTTDNLLRRLAKEGGTDDTEQPLRSLIRHFVTSDVRNNQNEVATAIINAAMNDPKMVDAQGKKLVRRINPMELITGPEVAGPGGPARGSPGDIATVLSRKSGDVKGKVSVFEDGERVYYEAPKELERLMKNLDGVDPGVLGKVLNSLNAPLRWGATAASPPFLVTNAIADAITTFVREGAGTAARIPKGYLSAARQDELWHDYIKAGGGMESLYQSSSQDLDKLIADTGGIVMRDKSDLARFAKDALTLQWIRRAGEVIEQGPHLAAFERHLAAGESAAQAAMAGRRATVDFGRSGDVLQQLNMMSLFLNARTQGTLNLGRSLRDDPIARLRLGGLAATVAMNNERNRQFPEYWDIPEYERKNNGIIMLPGSEKNDNGVGYKKINRVSIPLREISAFTDPLNWLVSQADPDPAKRDKRSIGDVGMGVLSTASPLSGSDVGSAAASLIPAPLKTPVELLANRRFYTGLPIVPQEYQDVPPSAQANDRTSLLARKIGEELGISPMQLDFIINENLGTLGRYGLGVSDAAMGKEGTEPLERLGATAKAIIGGLGSGVVRNYGGQMAADKYEKLDQLMGQFQEPIVARSIRAMPEYADATEDRRLNMMRSAQLHLRDTLREQVGIPSSTKDTGLPQKYPGVTDAVEESRIDRAVARWNAYKSDPRNAPVPSNEEMQLANLYGTLASPIYRAQEQIFQQENAAIRRMIEEELATAQGR
jgi:cell wall-associated NlpC family hydrolase/ribosomal protein S18 acetylase RimI-like enzyme